MATFFEICKAFATLPPFRPSTSNEEFGNSLPLSQGVNESALAKLISASMKADDEWPIGPFARQVETKVRGLREALRRECDLQVIQHPSDASFMDTKLARLTDAIIGAVTDWSTPEKKQPLQQFSAIAADFYFGPLFPLIGNTKSNQELPTLERPVATFSDSQVLGFHTISPDVMDRIIGAPVGLISMPTAYANAPILWVALAHEICGHDIVQAFDRKPETRSRLITELQASLSTIKFQTAGWRSIWETWLEEAIADVYGMICLGPHFAVGMAAWLSVTNAYSDAYPVQKLGELTNSFWIDGSEVSEHPPNLIRMCILSGALEALGQSQSSVLADFSPMLAGIIKAAQGPQSVVTVIDRNQGEAVFAYDAAPIIADARAVGEYIALVELKTLGGKSVKDLLPWTKEHRSRAEQCSAVCLTPEQHDVSEQMMAKGFTCIDIMAGALMAVTNHPSEVAQINTRLQQALSYRIANPGNGSE
jgi:hypothetical protein